jgi:hypothetical protein
MYGVIEPEKYLTREIQKIDELLDWLHQQALSGLPYTLQTSILHTKAVLSVQKRLFQEELTQLCSVNIKKGENDGINDHLNS